jgi:hypothetical protein
MPHPGGVVDRRAAQFDQMMRDSSFLRRVGNLVLRTVPIGNRIVERLILFTARTGLCRGSDEAPAGVSKAIWLSRLSWLYRCPLQPQRRDNLLSFLVPFRVVEFASSGSCRRVRVVENQNIETV